jgi:chloramphenicol 3-O-phosphotransferase
VGVLSLEQDDVLQDRHVLPDVVSVRRSLRMLLFVPVVGCFKI